MKHNWKLECTADAFVDMVIEDNPEVKYLTSMLIKLGDYRHDVGDVSEDERAAAVILLQDTIYKIVHSYQHSYKLTNLMNPHFRAIWRRSAKWLAPRLGITEVSAQQLKNTAYHRVYTLLSTAYAHLLARFGKEIPTWSDVNKDIKKYFKENL